MKPLFQRQVFLILFILPFLKAFSANLKPDFLEISESICFSSSDIYLDVINGLIDHVTGTAVLTDADFVNNHDLLVQNISVLSSDMEAVAKSFALIDIFEQEYGAIFTTDNTKNGFNKAYTSDGLNLHRNIALILQGLIDYSYTKEWLDIAPSLLDGRYFQTCQYFPGFVAPPDDPASVESALVKCAYMLANGSQPWAEIGNSNVVRPTGCYLAPGSIAEITVPESLVNKGLKIRVGAHFWNLENKNNYKRLDRVSILYDINDTIIKIAHPLGGGIYVEVPLGIDEGIQEISLKNVVRAPFYSKKSFHETSLTEWLETERKHPAPWADFESDKFMMQVPTGWIYNFDDPESLMEDWDKSMDAVSDLLGRPKVTDRHKNYLQFDVIIRGSAYHPGYPMSNTPYNPNTPMDGLPKHKILEGPQYDQDIHFHELGHEVAISKFAGETEALVNFLYVPVLNKCFGYSLDEAFQKSFGPSYNFTSTKDNTVRTRLVADTFHEGEPRNTCGCTKNEVRYQHRGYAHYVDIVELFGWEALENFWKSESDAADMGNPFPVNDQDQDDRILRMSQAAGVDLRPLFHFWGIHPFDQEALVQLMEENNLKLPISIKKKLHQYHTLIPKNYEEFVAFGNELYPDFLNYSGNQFDYGAGWYQKTAETYNESSAMAIEQALSDIIVYYYGTDCFEYEEFLMSNFSLDTQFCLNNELLLLPDTSDNGILGLWTQNSIDLSLPGQVNATFIPDLQECAMENTRTFEVFENISLEIDVIEPLCAGDPGSVIFDPSGGSGEGFSFSINGDSLTAGSYEVLVSDDFGCMESFEFLLTEPDPIHIEFMDNDIQVSGGTAPYNINMDTLDQTLIINVVDANGCASTSEFILSSTMETRFKQIEIFPNPASEEIYLKRVDLDIQIEYVQLISIPGQDIIFYPTDADVLDVSMLRSGLHLLQIKIQDGAIIHERISIFR